MTKQSSKKPSKPQNKQQKPRKEDEVVEVEQQAPDEAVTQSSGGEEMEDVAMLRELAKASATQMMEALRGKEKALAALQEAERIAQLANAQQVRLQAEFDNYRKRTATEMAQAKEEGAMETLRLLLPTLDNLERAQLAAQDEGSAAVASGIEMVVTKLFESFEKKGLKVIEALGQPFDPTLHEAVMREPCEDESLRDTVAQVLQKGYTYQDHVLRYCTVKVYA